MMRDCFLLVFVVQAAVVVAGELQVSKKEGETVKLPTGVVKEHHEEMLWYFNDIRIAMINGNASTSCLYDGEGGIFRRRLEVDNESGSLTIKDIRPEHAGRYQADYQKNNTGKRHTFGKNKTKTCDRTAIIKSDPENIIKTFSLTVIVSKKEGETVTLPTGVVKEHHEEMFWYFNNTRIAMINGNASSSCLYDGEGGIFRRRLEVDNESGSLTIKDIRPDHAGRYQADYQKNNNGARQIFGKNEPKTCDRTAIIKSDPENIIKTFSLTVIASLPETNKDQDSNRNSGLSAGAIAGICVAVVVAIAIAIAVVRLGISEVHRMMYCPKNKTNLEAVIKAEMEKNLFIPRESNQVSV